MAENLKKKLQKNHVLIGCTGSVASVKVPKLIQRLKDSEYELHIQLVPTEHSLHFFDINSMDIPVHRDEDEWQKWRKLSDPVLHIELRRWADLMIIAPMDANTLAKMANGQCDNLLTCVVRAWDLKRPLLYAPAMNTYMWEHPLTAEHTNKLSSFGYIEIPVVEKTLACGDKGLGGMAEVESIVQKIEETLKNINCPES